MIIYLQNIKKTIIISDNDYQNQNIYALISHKLKYSIQDFFLINKGNNKVLPYSSIINL